MIVDAGRAQHVPRRQRHAVVAGEVARVVDRHAPRPVVAGLRRRVLRQRRQPPGRRRARRGTVEWWTTRNEPPSCPYSLPIVLKQCGQAVTIVRSPIAVAVQRLDGAHRPGSGTRSRCPSAGPGRRCTTPPGRGPRTTRPPHAGTSPRPARPSGCAGRTPPRSRPSTGPRGRRARPPPATAATVGTSNGSGFVQSSRAEAGWPHGLPWPSIARNAGRQLLREARLLEDEVAPQPDDLVDVLDEHRAGLDARAAGHAVPHRVVRDRGVDDRLGQGGRGRLASSRP